MNKRSAFEHIHRTELVGTLTLPDRVLFRGHLARRDPRTLSLFLARRHVRLKDFGRYAQARTAELKAHAERLAAEANRPLLYLSSPHTARTGYTKEQLARDIAERDGDCEKFCVSDRRKRGVTWKSPKPVSRLLPCAAATKHQPESPDTFRAETVHS